MTLIYSTHLQNDNIFRCFFHFLKILIFLVHRGVKGQQTVQNDKKLSLLRSISQEPYIIWLSFIVQIFKMIISPGIFFSFKILTFWVVRELKAQKMAQNDRNFCLSHLVFQEPYIIWSSIMVHMFLKKDNISRHFFLFFFYQNFDFWDH